MELSDLMKDVKDERNIIDPLPYKKIQPFQISGSSKRQFRAELN